MTDYYKRRIIEVEKRLGFLYIPTKLRYNLPIQGDQVAIRFEGNEWSLRYNSTYNRIFGLTEFYRNQDINNGDFLLLCINNGALEISKYIDSESHTQEEENCETFDISGLSSNAKGNIAEDRVKEFILLYGQGLLNVYKPVIDKDGVDLIVLQSGIFHPVHIQVKSRYNVTADGQMILTINGNTFQPHYSFYIVAVSFNKQTLEIDNKILFIPSEIVEEKAIRLANGNLRIVACLQNGSQNQWCPYIISKAQLAEKIIEAISEMNKYYR